MKKHIKNKPASISQKLANIARREHIDFNALLLRYFQERLLYRLSISKFSDNFILKGGFFLICLNIPMLRPTKDIDFLCDGVNNDQNQLEDIFKDISQIGCDDGVELNPNSITSERIKEDDAYEGIRLKVDAKLGQARHKLQIDIGFGDVIFPKTNIIDFPALLDEKKPKVRIYSIESVISEKFEAMIKRGMFNSRMKDFYDIFILSETHDFRGAHLKKAILATFKQRHMKIPDKPRVFTDDFRHDASKQQQWSAFLRKTRLEKVNPNFEIIMNRIVNFLSPVVNAIQTESKMNLNWTAAKSKWE